MQIYIEGSKVETKRLEYNLYLAKRYIHTTSAFKKKAEEELKKAESEFLMGKD